MNLQGGAANDAFNIGGFALTGSVDGEAGGNTLSGVASVGLTATGFSGTAVGVSAGFSNISSITGTGTLTGLNTASTRSQGGTVGTACRAR